MMIGHHLPKEVAFQNIKYLEKYAPELHKEAIQFPPGRLYPHCDKTCDFRIETDCKNDEYLELFMKESNIHDSAIKMSLNTRKAALEKEDLCRKVAAYASQTNAKPSLVLSQYEYDKYISRCGKKLSDFWSNSVKNKKYLEGSCDCMWMTLNQGSYIFSLKSTRLSTKENIIVNDIRKAWRQSHKSSLMFESIVSDLECKTDIAFVRIIAFPHIPSDKTKQYLCSYHKNYCMSKEIIEDQNLFNEFFEKLREISCYLEMPFHEYSLRAGRYILFSAAIEFLPKTKANKNDHAPLEKHELATKVTEKISKIGTLYMTPTQKNLIDNFSIAPNKEMHNKMMINGHFGTGKTYTILLGIKKLVKMINEIDVSQHQLIIFFLQKQKLGKIVLVI